MDVYYRAGLDDLCHQIGIDTIDVAQVKSFPKTFHVFRILYTALFLSAWTHYTTMCPDQAHTISEFRAFMNEQQKLNANIRFWWEFLSVNAGSFFALRYATRHGTSHIHECIYLCALIIGTPEMFDVRVAACAKFAPLWAAWHKTNYKKLFIEQHADVLRLPPDIIELWKQTWTTGSENHKLNIDETIEFVNGDLDKVCWYAMPG